MATGWQTFPIEFRGGLISNLSPLQQGINAVGSATILQNYEPAIDGGYRKVKGFTKYIEDAISGSGPMLGVKVVDANRTIAVRQNGSASRYHIHNGSAWSTLGTAASLGGRVKYTEFNFNGTEKIAFVDGINFPAIYENTGKTLTFLTSAPAIEIQGAVDVVMFKSHLFFAKGDMLTFTAPYDETSFSAAAGAGTIRVGSEIVGLISFRDNLLVFAKDRIMQIAGNTVSDFAMAPVTEKSGCINGYTIKEIGGDIIYLGPDGFRLISATDRIDDFAMEVASDRIRKDAMSFLSASDTLFGVVIRNKAQYRVFAYDSTTQRSASKGLLATKFSDQGASRLEWATLKGFKVHCADSKYIDNQEYILYGMEDGYVYQGETVSDMDGANIEAIYESPYMAINDPQIRKTLYKIALYVNPTGALNLKCNIKFDFEKINGVKVIQPPQFLFVGSGTQVYFYGAADAIYGTAVYGGVLDKIYSNQLIGSGKTFAIRFEETSTNPTHTLDAAVIEYMQLDRQ